MAEIQASVKHSSDLSAAQTRAHNDDFQLGVFGNMNYVFGRKPEYFIYLYNLSELPIVVSRPPLFNEMKIPGRSASEEHRLVAVFPQPMILPKGNVDSNEIDALTQDARRFVADLLNPDNLGISQDVVIEKSTSAGTNDLGAKGLFWSYNGPGGTKNGYGEKPTEQEVKAARGRMEKRYRYLLDQAKTVEVSNPANLRELLSPEHHMAADYFGESFSWHNKQVRTDYCELCGEKVRAGVKFHKMDDGGMCIKDWNAAVKAGVRTRAQAYDATGEEQFAPRVAATVIPKNIPQE